MVMGNNSTQNEASELFPVMEEEKGNGEGNYGSLFSKTNKQGGKGRRQRSILFDEIEMQTWDVMSEQLPATPPRRKGVVLTHPLRLSKRGDIGYWMELGSKDL